MWANGAGGGVRRRGVGDLYTHDLPLTTTTTTTATARDLQDWLQVKVSVLSRWCGDQKVTTPVLLSKAVVVVVLKTGNVLPNITYIKRDCSSCDASVLWSQINLKCKTTVIFLEIKGCLCHFKISEKLPYFFYQCISEICNKTSTNNKTDK